MVSGPLTHAGNKENNISQFLTITQKGFYGKHFFSKRKEKDSALPRCQRFFHSKGVGISVCRSAGGPD
jgi:hypothetical protein